jgi:hypothetical protein
MNDVCSLSGKINYGGSNSSVSRTLILIYVNHIKNTIPPGMIKLFAYENKVLIHGSDSVTVTHDATFY